MIQSTQLISDSVDTNASFCCIWRMCWCQLELTRGTGLHRLQYQLTCISWGNCSCTSFSPFLLTVELRTITMLLVANGNRVSIPSPQFFKSFQLNHNFCSPLAWQGPRQCHNNAPSEPGFTRSTPHSCRSFCGLAKSQPSQGDRLQKATLPVEATLITLAALKSPTSFFLFFRTVFSASFVGSSAGMKNSWP